MTATATPAPPKPRRRWVAILVAVVLWGVVGAVVNVGVAWVAVACFVVDKSTRFVHSDATAWMIPAPREWPSRVPLSTSRSWQGDFRMQIGSRVARIPSEDFDRNIMLVAIERRAGLPFRSLEDGELSETPATAVMPLPRVNGWRVAIPLIGNRLLPSDPIWPGFALNTMLYGALGWSVSLIPGAIRRRRRRRAGRCVRCGYDLAGLAGGGTCPECGTGGVV